MKSTAFLIVAFILCSLPALADVTATTFQQLNTMISSSPQVGSCKLSVSPLVEKRGKKNKTVSQTVGATITLQDTRTGSSVSTYYKNAQEWSDDQMSRGIVDNPPQQSPHSSYFPSKTNVGWMEFDMIYANKGPLGNHPQRKDLVLFYDTGTGKVVGASLVDYQEDSTTSTLYDSRKTLDRNKLNSAILCGDTGIMKFYDPQADAVSPSEGSYYFGVPAVAPPDTSAQPTAAPAAP